MGGHPHNATAHRVLPGVGDNALSGFGQSPRFWREAPTQHTMARAYYNEIDKRAAAWLRELITAGEIAPGDVDERDIRDVRPTDLVGYTQCHFFAGIGGWSRALRLAGWTDDREAWTASCPCQPFSEAGRRGGFADERHLWPSFFHLARVRKPGVVFGEQVASKDGLAWLKVVRSDMEGWGNAHWIYCQDEFWRPIEPGTLPLAHGATERLGRLRGYGNAIVAPLAALFIESYLEARETSASGL